MLLLEKGTRDGGVVIEEWCPMMMFQFGDRIGLHKMGAFGFVPLRHGRALG